jgi:hypothetical protein
MKTFLEQDDVNERLEVIQSQIRNAAHKHKLPSRPAVRPNWTQRLVQSVTRHF